MEKLFDYDLVGTKENFILVYSAVSDFSGLWRKYLSYVSTLQLVHPIQGSPEEIDTPHAETKLARLSHQREGKEIFVYHVCVNMNAK